MSSLGDLSSFDLQKIWEGVHVRVLHGERITLGVVELDPGSHVPEHQHENEQLGICLSGSLVFRVGDETRDLGPGRHLVDPVQRSARGARRAGRRRRPRRVRPAP